MEYEWPGKADHLIGGCTDYDLTSVVRLRDGSYAYRHYDVRPGGGTTLLTQQPLTLGAVSHCLGIHIVDGLRW